MSSVTSGRRLPRWYTTPQQRCTPPRRAPNRSLRACRLPSSVERLLNECGQVAFHLDANLFVGVHVVSRAVAMHRDAPRERRVEQVTYGVGHRIATSRVIQPATDEHLQGRIGIHRATKRWWLLTAARSSGLC